MNETLEELQESLQLQEIPLHIECFDNSNFQGSYPVSAMVCFKNGIPSKSDYRKFNIKTVKGINDFASMNEAVLRRYQSVIEKEMPLPQLIIIDGGNSNYKDSQRRGAWLAERGIGFMDAGTSGGIWGLENGYCLMVGATPEVAKIIEPILIALAPSKENGWAHVGPIGAGHFTKMIHNGIEYGMMQAMAEGLDLLKGKEDFKLDLAQITELWRHGSVVRSWLLDLTADALKEDQELTAVAPYVADSGEGRWTVMESVEQGVAVPVLTLALQARFRSQDATGFSYKLLSMMRNGFGGHFVKSVGDQ